MLIEALRRIGKAVTSAYFACFLLAVSCCLLLIANRRLHSQLDHADQMFRAAGAPSIGTHFAKLTGSDDAGRPMTVIPSNLTAPVMVIALSPRCPHCKDDLAKWRAILEAHPTSQVLIVDPTPFDDREFVAKLSLPSSAIKIHLDSAEALSHQLQLTPTVVLLDGTGTVRWAWPGSLGPQQVQQLAMLLPK